MNSRKFTLFTIVSTLLFVDLACTFNLGGPTYPYPSIQVSTEAVGEMQSSFQTAVAFEGGSGQVTLSVSEAELTSYLYFKLQGHSKPLITNPQVYLRDGQLIIYGTTSKGYFQATSSIILNAEVDEQGHLKIVLTSADFGPLPVPNGIKEIITSTIQEAYTGALGPLATGFRLQSITISDGTMTIVGQPK